MESDKAQAQALLLFNCVHQGHFNVLRKLLKAGANPNVYDTEGEPLIFIPVVNGDYETLEVLLESGKSRLQCPRLVNIFIYKAVHRCNALSKYFIYICYILQILVTSISKVWIRRLRP